MGDKAIVDDLVSDIGRLILRTGNLGGPWLEAKDVLEGVPLSDYLEKFAPSSKISSGQKFFPPDVLSALLSPHIIKNMLLITCKQRGIRRENLDADVRKIVGDDWEQKDGNSSQKSWLKTFAILVLMQEEYQIFTWIDDDSENGIFDHNIPFLYRSSKSFHANEHSQVPLPQFKGWAFSKLNMFGIHQWQVGVPVFTSSEANPVPHHELDERHILPFLAVQDKKGNQYPQMLGGYGTVDCVRFPSSCYNFQSRYSGGKVPDTHGLFALKKLDPIGRSLAELESLFNREREMLRRFGDQHEHIIALLATFTYKGSFYLLFPWAECDLLGLWEKTPPQRDHATVLWIADQCLQLVNALHEIHFSPDNTQEPKRFGRHGDIKSENVLVFPQETGTAGHEKLVLADFGFSSVHRDTSISALSNHRVQAPPGCRPPEMDVKNAKTTRGFDIWTLGCLFLDMCTWWFGGWRLLQEFEEARYEKGIAGLISSTPKTNNYFNKTIGDHVEVKRSVTKWFEMLRGHEDCTQFMSDFLDLIETRMIIIEAKCLPSGQSGAKRIRTKRLKQKLEALLEKCKDESYALMPVTRNIESLVTTRS